MSVQLAENKMQEFLAGIYVYTFILDNNTIWMNVIKGTYFSV